MKHCLRTWLAFSLLLPAFGAGSLGRRSRTSAVFAGPAASTPDRCRGLRWVQAEALNDRGDVAGLARELIGRRHAAFRYSQARGMEDLDPDGRYHSVPLRLNERSQVFGAVEAGLDSPYPYRSMFVVDRDGSIDLLEAGLHRAERKRLRINFAIFNNRGQVATLLNDSPLADEPSELTRTFIYRSGTGWQDLTDDDPAFQGTHVGVSALNERGDAILNTYSKDAGGTEEFKNLVYLADRRRFEVPRYLSSLNNARRMAGSDHSRGEAHRTAYYFSPLTGIVDLHPSGFTVSTAGRMFEDGTFFLSAREGKPKRNKWSLFLIDAEFNRTLLYSWRDVRRFARRAACRRQRLARPLEQFVNRRGEVAGLLLCKGNRSHPFYFSPESGFELMQNLLDAAGAPELQIFSVKGLNESGQILLNVTSPEATTAAILTPLESP